MNLVGKIFIVLIFLASTVFMTMGLMVYSTHHNWEQAVMGDGTKGEPLGLKKQLVDARGEAEKLKGEIQKYQTLLDQEKAAHFEAEAKVETQRDILAKSSADAETKLTAKQAELEKAATDLSVSQNSLTAPCKEDADLRDDIRLANKATDEQLKKATALEDKLHIATGQLADLKARNDQLAADVAKARLVLSTISPGTTLEDSPTRQPPTVRGQILAVDKDNHAEISLGSDDGLRESNTLEIYRGDRYLGRMQLLEVHPHRAVGKIIKELQQDVIRTGDQVATRLKA